MCNNKSMERIGILGGTFNPVHNEHVALAVLAVEELKLDKLIVMPTYLSPHKNSLPASEKDRLAMLNLAFNGKEKIVVSDYEIQKMGKSYTYQTIEYFKQNYDAELFFIVGADMLVDFKTWRYPERILAGATLAVFDREDFSADFDKEQKYFIERFNKQYKRLSYCGGEISSTKIRVYSQFGLSLEGLADKKVEEYIKENNLYMADESVEYVKKRLPEKRLKHTADVAITALKRAKELGLDENKVFTACVLHDSAKYVDKEKVQGFSLDDDVPQPVVHSFLGAYLVEKELNIKDQDVLDAIKYHTSGKPQMTTLGKLVFVADMIEEGRNYEGVESLRELYEKGDFEKCFIECLKEEVLHLLNKKQYIYKSTLDAYDYYVNERKN